MGKILVAYFSASGTTAKLAANLASAINADLHEIQPQILYTREDYMVKSAKNSRKF